MKVFGIIRLTLTLLALTSLASCSGTQTGTWDSGSGGSEKPTPALTTLHSFNWTDGAFPRAAVIMDSGGNLYGTASRGGGASPPSGSGTVFKINTTGVFSVYHRFSGIDGRFPEAELTMDSEGNFLGTTKFGGVFDRGTVFKLDRSNTLTVLHSFFAETGNSPRGGLVTDNSDNFYGTTAFGGDFDNGVVFRIDASGTVTVLHDFTGEAGARQPATTLFRDNWGNLYGSTGLEVAGEFGAGMLFKLSPGGELTVLHDFSGTDGRYPNAVIMDKHLNLYGTTHEGGAFNNGTVFKLNKCNELTILHSFNGADGRNPFGALLRDGNGNLFGTTAEGGSFDHGTVFKLASNGKLTTLFNFSGSDGSFPAAGLLVDDTGNFYGTTDRGGAFDYGTVFKLALGISGTSWTTMAISTEPLGLTEPSFSGSCSSTTTTAN